MPINFDEIIDRRNTSCLKYDFAAERGYPADILPLWVADMDFRVPASVITALKERADLVILWPGLGPAGQVSHLSLHGTVDPRALTVPGRGVLVSRRSVTPLQCVGPAS